NRTTRASGALAVLVVLGTLSISYATVACELENLGDCLRMSDCDTGGVCVEGLCHYPDSGNTPKATTSDAAVDAPLAPHADAATGVAYDAAKYDASTSDAGVDAGDAATSDASGS